MEERDVMNFDGVFAEAYMVKWDEVWSKDRWVVFSDGRKRFYKGRRLIPAVNSDGYLQVCMQWKGNKETERVQRIIAMAYPEICGTWFEGCQVDHKDGNKLNNTPLNLTVCTQKENLNNPITLARKGEVMKERWSSQENREKQSKALTNHPNKSKEIVQLSMDGAFVAEYPSIMEAERQTGLNNANISECSKGKRKSAGGFRWLYKSDWEKLRGAA